MYDNYRSIPNTVLVHIRQISHYTAPSTNESVLKTSCVPESAGDSLSIAEITGMSTGITFIMATLLGFLAGILVMHLCTRKKAVHSLAAEGQTNLGSTVPAGPVYEEVSPKEEIELNINQAYGPLQTQTSVVCC